MKKITDLELIKKLKAKLYIKDELEKLNVLSKELKKGTITEENKVKWKDSLNKIEEYLPYTTEHEKDYKKFKERFPIIDNVIQTRELNSYTGDILAVSSIRGLFNTLNIQRKKHGKRNNILIVMGDWMGFPGDISSIHKAMDMREEGVFFLRGKTEEQFILENKEKNPEETFFIQSLPMDIQTPNIIITTGNSQEEPMPSSKLVKKDGLNLTGKTMVIVNPIEGDKTYVDNTKNLIILAPGDATLLELEEKKAKDTNY